MTEQDDTWQGKIKLDLETLNKVRQHMVTRHVVFTSILYCHQYIFLFLKLVLLSFFDITLPTSLVHRNLPLIRF